uniref:Uncharacterized protein n=1 Tax=Tanacetum cinerariifolium TaxID=118510 RepID=A0A6L2J5B0_TANCI|nr:hypothetical protein [Tanacetum cinerariifolium]
MLCTCIVKSILRLFGYFTVPFHFIVIPLDHKRVTITLLSKKFIIHQYLQNEHYSLWEVIKFGNSYKAPLEETGKGPASESSTKKKGRTIVITTKDIQKRRNDVKARITLLLAILDEHQLRFNKYETAKELWEAILKTFGGNEATKKTKKNQLKQQYGNFKAKGLETLKQTFNRLHAIVSHLEFMDVKIEQDDLNQKFLASLAPEWLIRKGKVHTASVPTVSTQVSTTSTDVVAASISHDTSYMANKEENHALVADDEAPTEFALMAKTSSSSKNKVKKEKEGLDNKLTGFESASKDLDTLLGSQRTDKNKGGSWIQSNSPPLSAQVYSPPKKDMFWTGLPEFVDDAVTDYSRPTPSIDSSKSNTTDCLGVIKTNKTKTARKSPVKYAEMYRNTLKSPKVKVQTSGSDISYLLAVANNLHWQWELILPVGTLTWQWECLVHFIPNNPPLNLMLLLHSSFPE